MQSTTEEVKVKTRTQGRNLEVGSETETREECLLAQFAFLYTAELPDKNGTVRSRLGPSNPTPRIAYQVDSIFSFEATYTVMTLACVKLTKKTKTKKPNQQTTKVYTLKKLCGM